METMFKCSSFRSSTISLITVLLALASIRLATAQASYTWTGAGADMNWSTPGNWSPSGPPGPADDAQFFDPGAASDTSTINNTVSASMTVNSLWYGQTNGVHNTLINPGTTLTLTGINMTLAGTNTTGHALLVGTETQPSVTQVVNATISGAGGTLAINSTNGDLFVRQTDPSSGAHSANLDMSGLGTFNATLSQVHVGVGDTTLRRAVGNLTLAQTNNITLVGSSPQFLVSDNDGNNDGNSTLSAVTLGTVNNIYADTLRIGGQKCNGAMSFGTQTGSLYMRGSDGTNAVSEIDVGDDSSQSGSSNPSQGTWDLSGGTADILADTVYVGRGESGSGSGSATGTITLGAGTLNVNSLEVAYQNASDAVGAVSGTVNVNSNGLFSSGATLIVNSNLDLGVSAGSLSGGITSTLNINGGTVEANQINCANGGAVSEIQMTGGLLSVSNTVGAPSATSTTLGYLILSSGAALTLAPIDPTTPSIAVDGLVLQDSSEVINIGSVPVQTAYPVQYPLITYTNADSGFGGQFSLGTLPGSFMGYITNDGVSTIWLVLTNGPVAKTDEWVGNVNNTWDTTTKNWLSGGNSVTYSQNDAVIFDDSAQTGNVTLPAARTPLGCTITNNSLAYTFSGSGRITGATGLEKDGTASATLAETGGDNFRGGIIANGGTLLLDNANSAISGNLTIAGGATVQIGNGDVNGNLPSGSIQDDGMLTFNRTDDLSVGVPIAGAGGLTQSGSGMLTLSGANSYTGNTTVNAGALILTGNGSISSSAQVTVGLATLDLSGLAGASTTFNNLSVANSTLNLAAAYAQTPVNVASLTAGGAANVINVTALPPIASYPATITLIKSSGTISGAFNFTLGTLPTNATYAGSITESADHTAVQLALTSGPVGVRPYVTWSGADALSSISTNWSDANNWQAPGAPGAGDYVLFSDVAAASSSPFGAVGDGPGGIVTPGNFNNIVNANFTVAELNYTNAMSDYQNTLLADGVTLDVSDTNAPSGWFSVGGGDNDFGTSASTFVTIGGANGTLDLNNTNGLMFVGLGSGTSSGPQATLDLSGLGTFNASISQFYAGVDNNQHGSSIRRTSGIVYLARTNNITATVDVSGSETSDESGSAEAIDIGDNYGNNGPESYLYLGLVNNINGDAIAVGRQKQTGEMVFNPAFNNPSAYFRGQDGVSPVSVWSIGDGVANTGTTSGTGTCDFTSGSGGSDGYVNALVDTMYIGRGAGTGSGSGSSSGILTFDDGVFNVNTLYAGYQPASGSKVGLGTINVNTNSTTGTSGTLIVNDTMYLGATTGGGGASSTAGQLSINGGTVQANAIAGDATGTSYITLDGGTLSIGNTAGAPGAPLTYLLLEGGTLKLNVNGGAGVTNIVATSVIPGGSTTLQIGSLSGVATGVTYPLISYTGSDPFSGLTLAPLPAGYAGTLVDDTADSLVGLQLTTVPAQPPVITGINIQGGNVVISGTNGTVNSGYYLLTSTNLALPLSDWKPLATNTFMTGGGFSLTNSVNANTPRQFYILQLQ
jgi:fibronectin-binding autotransporter adhesin